MTSESLLNVTSWSARVTDSSQRFQFPPEIVADGRRSNFRENSKPSQKNTMADAVDYSDRQVVLATVTQDGYALELAAEPLRADREVVLAAVTQDGYALEFAAEPLRADREFMLAAVTQSGWALKFAAEPLRADRAVVFAAVSSDCRALAFAGLAVRSDPQFVSDALQSPFDRIRRLEAELLRLRSGQSSPWTAVFADEYAAVDEPPQAYQPVASKTAGSAVGCIVRAERPGDERCVSLCHSSSACVRAWLVVVRQRPVQQRGDQSATAVGAWRLALALVLALALALACQRTVAAWRRRSKCWAVRVFPAGGGAGHRCVVVTEPQHDGMTAS